MATQTAQLTAQAADSGDPTTTTRIALVDERRLVRQTLGIFLTKQTGITVTGSASSLWTLQQWCEDGEVDVAIINVNCLTDSVLTDTARIAANFEGVTFVALAASSIESEEDYDSLLSRGFDIIVPSSAGLEQLLQALHPAATEAIIAVEEIQETFDTIGPLTPREAEVLSLVGRGNTTFDISEQLGISKSTVANHKERIFNKLSANNQAHAVARAVHMGLISPRRPEDPRQVG